MTARLSEENRERDGMRERAKKKKEKAVVRRFHRFLSLSVYASLPLFPPPLLSSSVYTLSNKER